MENASKALLIAGGILISVIIITIAMDVLNYIADYNAASSSEKASVANEAFNRYFVYYENKMLFSSDKKISSIDAYNIIGKARDINQSDSDDYINIVPASYETMSAADFESKKEQFEKSSSRYYFSYEYGGNGKITKITIN